MSREAVVSQFMEILEWFDETGEEMVHRLPAQGSAEIKFGAQLIVRESQEALFFTGGRLRDRFDAGRFTLSTRNLPWLTKALSLPWGFESPFRCEVYFVNRKVFTNLKWGTREPVIFRDAELGLLRLRAHGQISFRVEDGESFIRELVGTRGTFSTHDATDYLRDVIVARLNDYLGGNLTSIVDLAAQYDEIGSDLARILGPDFEKFGLALQDFFVTSITPPEEVQQMVDSQAGIRLASDMAEYLKYQAARNLGETHGGASPTGGMVEAGVGLGLGMMMPQMLAASREPGGGSALATEVAFCTSCGRGLREGDRFCGRCGHRVGERVGDEGTVD